MEKLKKSQILKLFVIITVLSITPLVSESLRPPYLYFVVNLLIIALGAEAGLLSFILKVSDHQDKKKKKKPALVPTLEEASGKQQDKEEVKKSSATAATSTGDDQPAEPAKEKPHSEQIKVKKSPSKPSLFFIGGGEGDDHQESVPEEEEEEEVDHNCEELTGQELFNKAETFIGNFYNQLKMQREESSNKRRPWPLS